MDIPHICEELFCPAIAVEGKSFCRQHLRATDKTNICTLPVMIDGHIMEATFQMDLPHL